MIHLSWFTLSFIFLAPATFMVFGAIAVSLLGQLTGITNKR